MKNAHVQLIVSFALSVFALLAQVTTGTIEGTVTDASDASVPKADVRVVNEETGAVRLLITDTAGNYVARNLLPGHYRVSVDLPGFQSQAKTGLVLSLDQTLVVNFVLQPGQQQQTVTVVSRGEQLIETATSSLGQVIEEAQIRDLPLNGRNFQQLIGLNTGAQPGPQGSSSESRFHLNGGRSEGNAFLIDGLDVSSFGTDSIRTFPSLEAIGEFKIITNGFSAEYGRSLSGVISTHIKNGTNQLHGTLFHFLRNKALDARNFFAPRKPKYIFNQFGGSAGGPLIKNKLFVFGDYQGTRIRQGGPQFRRLPTVAMRNGDFSALLPSTVIYDPRTLDTATKQRVPFPGNLIPPSAFDRPTALMLSALPPLNQSGVLNFIKVSGVTNDVDAFDVRADYHLNERNRLSAVVTYSQTRNFNDPLFPRVSGFLVGGNNSAILSRSASLNYTRVWGPSAVNELVVGWKRDRLDGKPEVGHQYESDLGIPFLNTNKEDTFTTGFPQLSITGYTNLGAPLGIPAYQAHNIPQMTDNFSFSRGKHAFKTGLAVRFRQFNLEQVVATRGLLIFNSLPTSNGAQFAGGDPVASALLGYPSTARRDFAPPWGERLKEYGFYFQDDWKLNRRLTLNLGGRYDLYPPATEAHNRLSNYDLASGAMILAGKGGASASTIETNKLNFSPHVGFAYLLTGDRKTVVRGGYGIGYLLLQTAAVGTASDRLTTNQPFKINFSTVFDALNPTVRVSDGLPLPVPDPRNPSGDVNFQLNRDPTPYMQQWNLNIQRALPGDFLAEIAYAGSRGLHLSGSANLNQARPGATAPGPRSLLNPNVNSILAILNRESSTYHSLQAKLQKRFARGFYLLGAYTFSKSIDDASFTAVGSDASTPLPQDSRNWRAERAASDFDFRHRLVVSYICEIPVGKGRRFLGAAPALVNHVLGGWQVNGITSLQSGNVFTPIVANPRTNGGPGGAIRPDRAGNGGLPDSERSIQRWFDTSAFVAQGAGGTDPFHFGNSGRNILRGPRLVNFDFSAFKEFPIRERRSLEFRAEFFNVLNHANFLLPDRSVDLPTSGVISRVRDPRLIQFALKLVF